MPKETVVEHDIREREMTVEEVRTSVWNPVLKRKLKAQRRNLGFQKCSSPVGSGLARKGAPDPPSDTDNPIVDATGRNDSRKRLKPLLGIYTAEKLKAKRTQCPGKSKERPSKKSKATKDAGDIQERRSSRGKSKGRRSKNGAMEIVSNEKFKLSVRGSNTKIDVTLTSPVKRVLNMPHSNLSDSEFEDAGGTEAPVRSRGVEGKKTNHKVPLKFKSIRKVLYFPSQDTVVADRNVAVQLTEDDGGEYSKKDSKEDQADRAHLVLSANVVNPKGNPQHGTVCNQAGSVLMLSMSRLQRKVVQDPYIEGAPLSSR